MKPTQKYKKLQFYDEPIGAHVRMPRFTAEINIFTAWSHAVLVSIANFSSHRHQCLPLSCNSRLLLELASSGEDSREPRASGRFNAQSQGQDIVCFINFWDWEVDFSSLSPLNFYSSECGVAKIHCKSTGKMYYSWWTYREPMGERKDSMRTKKKLSHTPLMLVVKLRSNSHE